MMNKPSYSHLKWLCRRGMKELDLVLLEYLEKYYEKADEQEKAAFIELLDYQDIDIASRLFYQENDMNEHINELIKKLRE